MQEVKLESGKTIVVRPITRGQIRALEPMGITAAGIVGGVTVENYGAKIDAVLGTQVAVEDIDALSLPDCRLLFQAIIAETWGSKEEEKN